jgi:hypothetical protein
MREKIKRPFGNYVKYKDVLTKEFLYNEHIINKKYVSKIAKEVGCYHGTVGSYLDNNEFIKMCKLVAEFNSFPAM